jgi:glycosyltransferase involved in cell wall biosynthesis
LCPFEASVGVRVGTFLRTWRRGGGVERHTLELIQRLDDVEWVCFGHEFEVDVPNPVEIEAAPGPAAVKDVVNLARTSYLTDRLKREHGLDLFHAQDVNTLGHDLVTVHSCFPAYAHSQLSRLYTLVHPMYYKNLVSQKLVLERTTGPIVAVSEDLRTDLLDFYDLAPERVRVIPNGVDLDAFHPGVDGTPVRAEHGIDEDTPLLLFVGHEYERKGFDAILQALARLPDEVELMSVGGGDREPWQKRARELGVLDRITWTGYVPDEALPEHYAASDVFVFPTRYESFGLVVLEAMATGTPVVTGDLACIREFVTDGEHGRLVTPDDVDALQAGIEHVLGPEHDAMSKRARERAERFGWDRMADETRALYEEILATRG